MSLGRVKSTSLTSEGMGLRCNSFLVDLCKDVVKGALSC